MERGKSVEIPDFSTADPPILPRAPDIYRSARPGLRGSAEVQVGRTPEGDVAIETTEEGMALYVLNLLDADDIPKLALLFLANGCDVPEMAALAGSLAIDHPADRRSELERAVRLARHDFPTRIEAAQSLKRIYAQRGTSGTLSPRDAARHIKDIFQTVEAELPKDRHYVGDSFDIATLFGLYYSYDDIPFDDMTSAGKIDRDLLAELTRLAKVGAR